MLRQMVHPVPPRLLPLMLLALAPVSGQGLLLAQRAELQVLAGEVSDESGEVGRGLTLAPAIAWAGTPGWLRLDGRATALEGGSHLMGAGAAFHLVMIRKGPVELGTSGSAGLVTGGSGLRSLSAEATPGVRLHAGASSVGAGVGVHASSLRTSASGSWREKLPLAGVDGDDRAAARSVWAEGRTGIGAVTLGVLGRALRADGASWREGRAGASAQLGAVALSAFVGARAGVVEGRWAGAGAAFQVATGVELTAQLARHPSDPLTGLPGGRTAAVGFTLSRGAPAARASRAPERTLRLALRAAPDARVELLGDWNDWRPEPVTHRGGGVYDVELVLPPGLYHFVLRVDGELRLPEGYETAPDDFGGRSAVVRVQG